MKRAPKTYYVTGNTFEHRDDLRAAGAEWDKANKRWTLEIVDSGFKRNDGVKYRLQKLGCKFTEAR